MIEPPGGASARFDWPHRLHLTGSTERQYVLFCFAFAFAFLYPIPS